MALTKEPVFRDLVVLALGRLGGSAERPEVLAEIELLWGGNLTPEDHEPGPNRPFEEKWRNHASQAFRHMKSEGLVVSPRRGLWELARPGWDRLGKLRATPAPAVPPGAPPVDPLKRFAPKDSSDYVAHLAGQVLEKTRAHEQLVDDYGRWAEGQGFRPFTPHPRDLTLEYPGGEWLVEAKEIRDGNATKAVREAIGQLFEYRHVWYVMRARPVPSLLGLFSEPVGALYVELLDSLSIASVWRSGGSWAGSAAAVAAGLAAGP
jgi:hypothetical protein